MTIDFEQIQKDISDIRQLVQSLHERLSQPTNISTSSDEVLSISQTASILDLSKATVYGMVYERRIPFHKPIGSRRLYFMRSEVIEWLRNGRKSTTEELTLQASQSIAARLNRRTNLTNRRGGRVSHD